MAYKGQARVLSTEDEENVVKYLKENTKFSNRNIAMFLLTVKVGLRAVEVSGLRWHCILEKSHKIRKKVFIPAMISKGKYGEFEIKIAPKLKEYLELHYHDSFTKMNEYIFLTRHGGKFSANYVAILLYRIYQNLEMPGYSSHSGRRTFITRVGRAISKKGGSMIDVMKLARHTSMASTQRYMEGNVSAQEGVIKYI